MNILKIYKKIVDFTSDIIYIFAILYALVHAPMLLGHNPVVIQPDSPMLPTLKAGSIVYYTKAPESELEKYNMIAFSYDDEDEVLVSRIESNNNGKFQTKADGNENADSKLIEYSNIKGKVSNVFVPFIGYLVDYVNHNMYIIVCAILILISEFILDNLKCYRK